MSPLPSHPRPPAVALVSCQVLADEVATLAASATHIVRRESFAVGLHDRPLVLREHLAAAIARAEADPAVEAVVLVYGLCGLALVDLAPRRCPLIVPRAHDCLTLFLGSKERYADAMRREPGTYWYVPGWNRERRGPGPERTAKLQAEYTARFGAEEAAALLEIERESFALHTTAGYTDLRLPGDDSQVTYAKSCADSLGWTFETHPGDRSLLRDLIYGPWDEQRFLIVPPGRRVAHSADDNIVQTAP